MSDVKEKILDALDDVREQASLLLRDFKEQTVYFKAKAAVVAGYVAIVILSVLIFPPAGEKNPLDARVKVSSFSFGSKDKAYVTIQNDSSKSWDAATITITGTFVPDTGKQAGQTVAGTWSLKDRWRRGEKKEFTSDKFRDKNNLPAEINVKIEQVIVDVDGVQYVKSMTRKPSG